MRLKVKENITLWRNEGLILMNPLMIFIKIIKLR